MGYISQHNAINHMLLMAGESPVTTAEYADGGLDVSTAVTVLDQYVADYNMRGQVGNRILKKYTLTTAGNVNLSSLSILSGELVSYHENADGMMIQAQVRGQQSGSDSYLYNITDQTATWDADKEYTVEIIYSVAWDDIDTPLQRAIMAAAARQYQLIMQGDADADAYLQNLEAVYTTKAKASNIDDRRRHFISQLNDVGKRTLDRRDLTDTRSYRYWRTWNG